LSTSIRIPYDFATLNLMFGMLSVAKLSRVGRIDDSMTERSSAGESVCRQVS